MSATAACRAAIVRAVKTKTSPPALGALVLVTAVWGITFVQIKDALELYPLFAFLAVRFAIAVAVLAVPAAPRLRSLGRDGAVAGCVARRAARGRLRAADGRARAHDGLGGGLRDRDVRRAHAGLRLVALPHPARPRAVWLGVALAVARAGDAERRLGRLGRRRPARPRRRRALRAADRADGALRAALRPARVHDGGDGRGVRRLRRRSRSRPGRSRCRTARRSGRRCS